MGGSDQWSNIICGVDLIRRTDGKQAFGMRSPRLPVIKWAKPAAVRYGSAPTNSRSMPSGNSGATPMTAMSDAFCAFSPISLDEIARLEALQGAEINAAKKTLANEVTTIVHGAQAAQLAAKGAHETFELNAFSAHLPVCHIRADDWKNGGFLLVNILVKSGPAARQMIRSGGVRVNDVAITDDKFTMTMQDLRGDGFKLSVGRKQHRRVMLGD
jgi:tyrosyl-tRNA synthetase